MTEQQSLKASCLCGAVTLHAKNAKSEFDACHCSMCAKWGGGPFLGVECGSEVTVDGEISVFASSDWAERAFCGRCGTHLYYRLKAHNAYVLPMGLFDQRPTLAFEKQIFIDEKPDEYSFAEKTPTLTGQEVFKLYSE
ncbi:GFA family protein [Litorivivens sp.]|uniref:GFA family protein n=1 Tax=Litorivivens sp. TaxID=2020868 RepID=UPI003569C59B